ncbi:unnamed protein product [Cunninghamella echinulata]
MSIDTFNGWICTGKDAPLQWGSLPLKTWDDNSVEMNITHCGICGSDIYTLNSGWGPTNYPCVVGHEIVGVATRVGANVTKFKVGDRIGVGAQVESCLECENCKSNQENICLKRVIGTYNSKWYNGEKTYGGYANKWRGNQHFVFKIPDHMTNQTAATFFCAGITTYSPLKRYEVQAGSQVGVIGIGGLGHFALMFSKAMGATKVVALSHSDKKRQDAQGLGATDYVVTSNKQELKKFRSSLSHIICCAYHEPFDWKAYLSLLKPNGVFILVALPDGPISGIPAGLLVSKQVRFCASMLGSPKEIEEMLEFADKHQVKPWINKYNMSEAPLAIKDFRDGKPRYRIVLENKPASKI